MRALVVFVEETLNRSISTQELAGLIPYFPEDPQVTPLAGARSPSHRPLTLRGLPRPVTDIATGAVVAEVVSPSGRVATPHGEFAAASDEPHSD